MTEIPPQSPTNNSPNHLHMVLYILIGVLGIIIVFGVVVLVKLNLPRPNPARIIESTRPTQIVTPTVVMKEEYSNPFAQPTTYQNPFSATDNPFDSLTK